ncbi:ABC transporter permease [Chromobacterium paludis]
MPSSPLKSANSAFSAGIFIFQPMLLLSGASFPLENLPPFMRVLVQIAPMTHVVAVLRAAWRGQFFTTDSLGRCAFLILLGGMCALISHKTFRWSSMQSPLIAEAE